MRGVIRSILAGSVVVVLATGCSEIRGAVDDALSAGLRTAASAAVKQAVESRGLPLEADPDCTGGVKTETGSADISCQARTQSGLPVTGQVAVTGAGKPDCTGTLTVTIEGQPPFSQDFAGCSG